MLTKKELAELTGLTSVTLTRLETGQTTDPTTETIKQLADALDHPVEFFYAGNFNELTTEAVSFRSLTSLTAKQRESALAAGAFGLEFDRWITAKFNLPTPSLLDLRDEPPKAAAVAIRNYWAIGIRPINDLIKLLEAKGVRVFALTERHKNVDAYSFWSNGVPYIFLNTFKSAERSRFDAAHELGHLLMHQHSGPSTKTAEQEADQFASSFLVPEEDLVAHLPRARTLTEIINAKTRWGVSAAALTRSLFNYNLVSDWHYRELCKQLSINGYRTSEPNPIEREKSTVWKVILRDLWRDGYTKQKIAKELHMPFDILESLLGPLVNTPEIQGNNSQANGAAQLSLTK